MLSAQSLSSFPTAHFETVASFCLVEHRPFSTSEGGISDAFFFHSSLLQGISVVMFWPVNFQKVPQGSE